MRYNISFFCLMICLLACFSANAQISTADDRQMSLDSLPPIDSLGDWQVLSLSNQLNLLAYALSDSLNTIAASASALREQATAAWEQAAADSLSSAPQLDSLAALKKSALKAEKNAQGIAKAAAKMYENIKPLPEMPVMEQRKKLPKAIESMKKWQKRVQPKAAERPVAAITGPVAVSPPDSIPVPQSELAPAPDSSANAGKIKTKRDKKATADSPSARFTPYDPEQDVLITPPAPPCVIASEKRDEFSGELRRETARRELFRYTNPALKNYLQGKTQILCEVFLGENGNTNVLQFVFSIYDPSPRRAFGGIAKNSTLLIRFIDGETMSLVNSRTDEGLQENAGAPMVFRAVYGLDKSQLKKLKTSEIDKIRMSWVTGYEDYEVQQIDALMHLSECLSSKPGK